MTAPRVSGKVTLTVQNFITVTKLTKKRVTLNVMGTEVVLEEGQTMTLDNWENTLQPATRWGD